MTSALEPLHQPVMIVQGKLFMLQYIQFYQQNYYYARKISDFELSNWNNFLWGMDFWVSERL